MFRPDCDPRDPLTRQGSYHQCDHHGQVCEAQQLKPNTVFSSLVVSTGLGSPPPAWSLPVLIQPGPAHPVLRGCSVIRLRDGMGWHALCDVMLHSRLLSLLLLIQPMLSVHCANPLPRPASTGKLSDLCDPSSMTDGRDLLLL